ncbi:hypothetical protein B0J11DRAFT_608411 [Dendryphion nanum]|uniref:Uncharacterized protein n=1 Tax=Dendryphion nanum TaxID=256645 RepID=A0A9P9DNN8_9PLEO|nr:hypothetical protein B0J11DRAFT_608411 [Dendryphion nanum]
MVTWSSATLWHGTILWLPKQKDIEEFDVVDPYNTVPDKCFGHSVLVLGEEKHINCITILILTSFSGGEKVHRKVKGRGHKPRNYIPIHPAPPLIEGTPSLRLSASQEFVKQIWANVLTPHRCPKAWLQTTWPRLWKWDERGRRIEPNSLHTLVLYAMQEGYNPVVYREILERYTVSSMALHPHPGPVRVNMPEDSYTYMPATIAIPPNRRHDSFLSPRSEGNNPRHVLPEHEPLLPQTNRRSNPITHPYRAAGTPMTDLRGTAFIVDFVVRLPKRLLFLGVIIGAAWTIFHLTRRSL